MIAILAALSLGGNLPAIAAPGATLLAADFNTTTDGFSYLDDAFGTSQPSYADGLRTASGGYGSSGGLQITLGGVNANTINGMSGGWSYNLSLASAESGVAVSFRYKLEQTAAYEYNEYSRVLVKLDDTQLGRGSQNYIDHIGGDGSSSQGSSNTYLPTTDWQQVEVFIGDLTSGSHTLVLGGYNSKKDASDESTTLVIDDVLVTSGNAVPSLTAAQQLVNRVDINQFLSHNQGVAQFDDRCRFSGMGCSSTDYTTNYMNALAWVESQLQAWGYTTVRHSFNYNGNTGTNLWATKLGSTTPTEMYMISAHLDGRGGGDAFNDDGSGVALVMEAARVFAGSDVTTDKSVRFIFWDKEEGGLYGAYGYASNDTANGGRRALQGSLDEPTWLGLIQHDMILYDHGAGSVTTQQSIYADLDVEWRAGTTKEADSRALALGWRFGEGLYAPDYPATAYNYSTNTDDTPFHPYVASISVRENRRSLTSGSNAEWINPYYHTANDIEASYTRDDDGDGRRDDIELGYNAVRATVGLVAELAGVQFAGANNPPTANPQSVGTSEDTAKAITLSGSDPDGDPLTFHVTNNPAHGVLTGAAPNLTYTPNANYFGGDSFEFVANDGVVDSNPASVSITITQVNDPPTADPKLASTTQGTPVAITLSGSDIENDPLTFNVTSGPGHGSLSGVSPNLTYTPTPGYSGSDSFQYVANDGAASSSPATVSITIQAALQELPFIDDFESDRGWSVNPNGTDSASSGQWERADPNGTDLDGPKQLNVTTSETTNLVTGSFAGKNANSYDIDGGITSIQSPLIQLPAGQEITLSLRYYLAHAKNASPADFLRIKVIGSTAVTILELTAANSDVDASWKSFQASLNSFAGQSVRFLIEAGDLAKASLVEAAVDDFSVTAGSFTSPLLSANFDSSSDGFTYLDDVFRGTSQPGYADGAYQTDGGINGGGLQVILGGVDSEIVQDISGGWQTSFSLAASSSVTLTFWCKLIQSADYESEEISQVLVSVDGVLLGLPPNDFITQIFGNGNGGADETTGWQLVTIELGPLAAGSHTLVIGGYNNQKTYDNEFSVILIDEIVLVAR
jgi:hypothetical protein